MSPLDDELRSALHSRTSSITSSPDLFAGVEQRARRMRRNRAAGAVAGSALAVSALGLGGPLVASSLTADDRQRGPVAAPETTLAPASDYVLDPADPWAFRGDEKVLADGSLGAYTREWAVRHRVDVEDVTFWPLFGQVDEPSLRAEVVYVATVDSTGEAFWGVTRSSEAGPDFPVDVPLADGTTALPAALPGDEVGRLLVVAAPETSVQYSPGDGTWVSGTADGTMQVPLEGDLSADEVRVLADGSTVVFQGPAPDPVAEAPENEGPGTVGLPGEPANLLSTWPQRGEPLDGELGDRLDVLFRQAVGDLEAEGDTAYRPLFTGSTDSGVSYTVGQAWVTGGDAYTVALSQGGAEGEQFFLGPKTDAGTPVVAALVCCLPGTTTDLLVVVPQPGTGQVLYGDDDATEYRPVGEGQDHLDGVVLIDRSTTADRDRLKLLDGNGDLNAPTFEGDVADLLCGLRGCG